MLKTFPSALTSNAAHLLDEAVLSSEIETHRS